VPLYGKDFAEDPRRVYDELRRHGPAAPVELAPGVPATLVLGYDAALEVLRDPGTFPKDPSRWEKTVPADCPLLAVMGSRPSCLFTDGEEHARLRSAVTDALGRIDDFGLRLRVEETADELIDELAGDGEADLVGRYARPLPVRVFTRLFGCPPGIAERILRGLMGVMEVGASAGDSARTVAEALADLVALKRERPGADLASWMMSHPARLDDDELGLQIYTVIAAGTEPELNLIANGLLLLLSDDRFASGLSGGSLPVEDALDEILWTDPPLANLGTTYPVRDLDFAGVRLPADEPVLVSFAAANTDPSRAMRHRTGNRAHLAWSAGPHTCPAKRPARLIASVAIEKLLDRIPEMELAVPAEELAWRPGPFHRALSALPVRFPPQ
jgi:cytochrome P450